MAHHAGRSFWRGGTGLNTWSFGVELANWGYLKEQGNAWVSWTGRVVPNAVLAAHRNGNPDNFQGNLGWEPYPAIQIRVAAEVVRTIADRYGIQELVGHDDISVGRKWDPGPAFDMARSRDLATGDDSDNGSGLLITWTPGDTLNLRAGPGVEFATDVALADGTTLEPLEFRGIWVLVNVLKDDMSATRTGWVNTRHTRTA